MLPKRTFARDADVCWRRLWHGLHDELRGRGRGGPGRRGCRFRWIVHSVRHRRWVLLVRLLVHINSRHHADEAAGKNGTDCDADNSAHINIIIIIIIIMRWRRGGARRRRIMMMRRRRRRGAARNIERQCRACPEINQFWLIVFPSNYPYNTFCEMMEWFEHPISAHIPFASACIRPAHLRALVNVIMQVHVCFRGIIRHMEVVDRVAVCLFVCRCMLFRRTAQRTNGKGQQARCLLTGTGTCQQT